MIEVWIAKCHNPKPKPSRGYDPSIFIILAGEMDILNQIKALALEEGCPVSYEKYCGPPLMFDQLMFPGENFFGVSTTGYRTKFNGESWVPRWSKEAQLYMMQLLPNLTLIWNPMSNRHGEYPEFNEQEIKEALKADANIKFEFLWDPNKPSNPPSRYDLLNKEEL